MVDKQVLSAPLPTSVFTMPLLIEPFLVQAICPSTGDCNSLTNSTKLVITGGSKGKESSRQREGKVGTDMKLEQNPSGTQVLFLFLFLFFIYLFFDA